MRRWAGQQGRQTQCLLCGFGLTNTSSATSSSIRSLSTTTIQRKRGERLAGRSRFQQGAGLGREDLKRSERAATEFKNIVIPPSKQALRDRLNAALEEVYRKLKRPTDTGPSQLKNLDSDGEAWNGFQHSMRQLLAQSMADLDWKQKEQSAELSRLLSGPQPILNAENYLYFTFLDQTLGSKGLDVTNAMQRIIDMRYPTEWFPEARAKQRDVHLHIGPTNSGKTYNALKRLEAAKTGFYAGPLRLLAHEVYSRFNAKGIVCDLVTGDDVRFEVPDGEQIVRYASTVEMVDVSTDVDVAVIDEIQMMADIDRGWAWTRAFVGCCASEVHLCGEARVLPLVKELCASMGDNLHVHRYERLNPLKVMSRSLRGDLKKLRKGDCIVTFSIMNIHALRKQIEQETGRRVAIVYGSLPPETRAQQAALFNDPDNDYDFLVASDAIGMGLNLSIKRIIFDAVTKFDGISRRQLSIPQIKQIAGRAGRYRTARDDNKKDDAGNSTSSGGDSTSIGLVTCVDEQDLPVIQSALTQEAPPIRQAGLLPPGDFIVAYADRLPPGVPHDYVMQRICDAASVHPRFSLCRIRDQMNIAREIEKVRGLTTAERTLFTAAPAEYRSGLGKDVMRALARAIGNKKQVNVADVQEIPLEVLEEPLRPSPIYLEKLEGLHRSLILFLWLSYRYMSIFKDQDMAFHAKALTEEKINEYLRTFSANKRRSSVNPLSHDFYKSSRHIQLAGAVSDFSEHATESLEEEVQAASAESAALPINWARGADEVNEIPNEGDDKPKEQAASVQS